jgi:hypothetical protein
MLAIVAIVILASLSVVGCVNNTNTASPSPTAAATSPTPAANADYSSYFGTAWTSGNAIVMQPFTKGTNERGNDVYKGVTRNASLPAS